MAENKNAKKAAAAAAPKEEATSGNPADEARKAKKKSRWTEDTCKKAAKRYNSREDWAKNAPSSYKAAVAKGWDAACTAHMTGAPKAKVSAPKPAAKSGSSGKSSVPSKSKSGGKLPKSA